MGTLEDSKNETKVKTQYLCIECGERVAELYKVFNSDIIKITHCCNCKQVADQYIEYDPVIILLDALPCHKDCNCKQVADKYIEYDPVIILLDALLFKPQAFRHILFNTQFTFHWKLSIVCLLCDAYTKWARLSDSEDPSTKQFLYYALQWGFYAMFLVAGLGKSSTIISYRTVKDPSTKQFLYYALQWGFYAMFLVAGMELLVFLLGVILPVQLFVSCRKPPQVLDVNILVKALLLSSCGKLLVIPAVLWGQTDIQTCLWLTKLFTFTASCQAVRVMLHCRKITACVMVLSGFLADVSITGLSQTIEGALMKIS